MFEEKQEKMNYWNKKLLSIKGQTMTLLFMGGHVVNDVKIDSVDLVKGLVYFRPNNGRGELSFVKWNTCLLLGKDIDPQINNMDLVSLSEAV